MRLNPPIIWSIMIAAVLLVLGCSQEDGELTSPSLSPPPPETSPPDPSPPAPAPAPAPLPPPTAPPPVSLPPPTLPQIPPPLPSPSPSPPPPTFPPTPSPSPPAPSPSPRPEGPAPSEPLSPVDQALDQLELGNVAFNSPGTLRLGESTEIQLLLSLTETVEELREELEAEGAQEGAEIRIAPQMEARLTGRGFGIEAITPEVQAISARENTEWRWQVEATKEGEHRLNLTLTAILDVDGERMQRKIETFARTIIVEVTAGQRVTGFVANNWQWLWTAILIPIAGWLWRRKRAGNAE